MNDLAQTLHGSRFKTRTRTNCLISWILGSKSSCLRSTNGCLDFDASSSRSPRWRRSSIHWLLQRGRHKRRWNQATWGLKYRNGIHNEPTQRRELHNHKRSCQHGLRWHSRRVVVRDNRLVKCAFALTRNSWKDKHLGGQVCQGGLDTWSDSDIRYGRSRWSHIKRARQPLRHNFPKWCK